MTASRIANTSTFGGDRRAPSLAVGRDPEASAEVFRLAVPTIVIDERVFLGFGGHRDEIEGLVRE